MFKNSRWINFLGGKNLLFTLIVLMLIGIVIYIFTLLDFIFYPILVIFSNILIPVIISLLLYYLFVPLVDFMENKGINRLLAVIILYITVLFLIVALFALAIPTLYTELLSFVESFPALLDSFSETIESWLSVLPFGTSITSIYETAEQFLSQVSDYLLTFLSTSVSGLTNVLSNVVNIVMTIVLIPIIVFFLLKDGEYFYHTFYKIIPPVWRKAFDTISTNINSQVGSYVKGQLIIAVVNGLLMYAGFLIIGLDYSGVLATIGAFTSIIPYLGPIITFFPALVIALINSWFMVLKLIIVWLVIQFIEGNLVEPNVMGRQLKVHPLTIIIVLLVMGDMFGLLGLIFGVPFYAILKVVIEYLFSVFKLHYNKYFAVQAGPYELNEDTPNKSETK